MTPRGYRGAAPVMWSTTLAKVGVEGSNPFARSSFFNKIKRLKTVLRGPFLL